MVFLKAYLEAYPMVFLKAHLEVYQNLAHQSLVQRLDLDLLHRQDRLLPDLFLAEYSHLHQHSHLKN